VRLNRRYGRVWIPKVGWVRFRLSRPVPQAVKSFRITRDRSGRWHIAFAHVPEQITGPADGTVVGIDRGVAVSAALSTGELLHAPGLTGGEAKRLKVLQQRLGRSGARTVEPVPRQRSPNSMPARPIGAKTGSKRPPRISRDGSRPSASRPWMSKR
jgi:putative transposase